MAGRLNLISLSLNWSNTCAPSGGAGLSQEKLCGVSETEGAAENCTGADSSPAAGRVCAAAEAAIARLTMGSNSRCRAIVIFPARSQVLVRYTMTDNWTINN